MLRRSRLPSPWSKLGLDRRGQTSDKGGMSSDLDCAQSPAKHLTVAELTGRIKGTLASLGRLSVVGEVTGVTRATSGHIYFKLKDRVGGAESVIAAVVWRNAAREELRSALVEGAELVCHGRLDVYGPRGTYSLIVDSVERRGVGELMRRFEELKQKLLDAGWFERRRELPSWPKTVGVVTSRDTAAWQDFLRTRDMRWRNYPVRLAHAPVQGAGASLALAQAVAALDASGVDLIVVTRGGGSIEDLWAFNERPLLEAMRAASVPVVSGVGHETDTTLADFVADHRAHTPTDAAQLVIPNRAELLARFERALGHLGRAVDQHFARRSERLVSLSQRASLKRPERLLEPMRGRLARAGRDLLDVGAREIGGRRTRLALCAAELRARSPQVRLERASARLAGLGRDLFEQAGAGLSELRLRVELAARGLETTSPFAVLERGYSITRDAEGRALRSAGDAREGMEIETVLAEGAVRSKVTSVQAAGGSA